jgi:hypothetical protein
MDMDRLTKYYPKPDEGEEIPVSFLGMERKWVGWSPRDARNIYIDENTDTASLKRVRTVNSVRFFNWLSGRESIVDLSDEEMKELKDNLSNKDDSQIVYTRVKISGRFKSRFLFRDMPKPRRYLLSERF